ncbi:MAG: quinone-dependent dihydroorotate dehydrogenase [Ferruginibacter sp.]
MYKILRAILFAFDPEKVHYFSMNSLRILCRMGFKPFIAGMFKPAESQVTEQFNIRFSNKVGLGAGFDKNARYLNELEALGFGFVEIGTVTPLPQAGNEKPRLFRLPKDKALINRMGFNNDGVAVIVERLKAWNLKNANSKLIVGGNIGKNKVTPNEDAWKDYETCFLGLHEHVSYFVVNVSSPNTPGLRALQEKDTLTKILGNLQELNRKKLNPKPILLKIAPDLTKEQIDDVIELAMEIKLDGLVAANTTISREGLISDETVFNEMGGLSGAPLRERSTEIVRYINQQTKGTIPVIASGGIFTGADALEKMEAGASLIQVWTGFIYEGPAIVKNICKSI